MNKKTFNEYNPEFYIDAIKRKTKYNMKSHFHEAFEIFYLVDGERKYFINDTIYKITSGSIVLIDINEIHKTAVSDTEPHERIVINFTIPFLSEIISRVPDIDLYSCFKSKYKVLQLSLKDITYVENILSRMLEIYECEYPTKRFYLQILLCELLLLINNHLTKLTSESDSSEYTINPKISKILKYINCNYNKDITLASISKEFYISPFYLSKLFKQNTNFTLVQYLHSVRIKKAKELLQNTNYRVIDIAQRVGFNSHAHFTRIFKSITGISPIQYRKIAREK